MGGDWLKDSPRDDGGDIDPRDFAAQERLEHLADLIDGVEALGVVNEVLVGR